MTKCEMRGHLDGSTTIEISHDDAYTLLFTPEQALDLLDQLDQRKGELTRLVNAQALKVNPLDPVVEDLDEDEEKEKE